MGKHVILCIDDDPDILLSLRVVLESRGYVVVTAATAPDGLRAYQERRPDLLIVDLMMEQIDTGLQLLADLRALGNTAPIFFLSSTGDYLQGTTDLSEFGVMGVFQKPLDPDVLLALIERRLGKPAA